MGKVEAPRRTHSVVWRGSQYPYSPSTAPASLASAHQQQARRQAMYQGGGNGVPRVIVTPGGARPGGAATSIESVLASLSERMRASATRLRRSASFSSSSSGSSSPAISPAGSGLAAVLPGTASAAALAAMEADRPLKRLAFVRSQGSFWLTWMSTMYSTGRTLVPLPRGVLAAVEGTMADLGGSIMAAASYQSEKVLHVLDSKVDSVISCVEGGGADDDGDVWWDSLGQRPAIKYVVSAYQQAHDAVAASQIYNRALESCSETMARLHDSRLYKTLLPLVGPLTEPAVRRILGSPTFQAVKHHLAPLPPAVAGVA